jgi:hypothetical protein
LKQAKAEIRLKEGRPLEVEKLRRAVAEAGFTPTWIRFEAVGLLITRDGSPVFKVQGTEQIIPLVADETLEALRKVAGQDGKLVAIRGLIPNGKDRAQVERLEVH